METEIWKYYLVKILHAVHNPHFSMATCHYTNSKFKIKLKKKIKNTIGGRRENYMGDPTKPTTPCKLI